ncbi:MAG: protein kinase, partial [Actinobacteria bacterium]|nr:protein kinase [Actinomycetota bacterium]
HGRIGGVSSCHRLILSPGGRLVIVKEAASGDAADRLRREAEMLRQASHPGVVELVGIDELDGGGAALTTVFVAGGTLGDSAGRLEPAAMARVVAGLATTLADLHDRGIVHGRVSADHVLLASTSGKPVLCGLAEARTVERPAEAAPDATDDTEALAALVATLTSPGSDPLTGALRQAVERWHAGAARPTLRSLAVALAGLVPDEPLAAEPGTTTGRSLPPRRRSAPHRRPGLRWLGVAGAGAGAVAVGIVAAVALASAGGEPSSPAAVNPPVAAAVPERSTSTSSPATTSTVPPLTTVPPPPTTEAPVRVFPPPECPPADPPAADVDGDGCPDPVEVSDGVVAAAGARWQVGAPDDLVVIGDWDCDGLATPAVVRPSSGHVWTFPRWADDSDGDGVVAEPVGVVPAPVSKATVVEDAGSSGGGRCDGIEVIASGGDRRLVDAGA